MVVVLERFAQEQGKRAGFALFRLGFEERDFGECALQCGAVGQRVGQGGKTETRGRKGAVRHLASQMHGVRLSGRFAWRRRGPSFDFRAGCLECAQELRHSVLRMDGILLDFVPHKLGGLGIESGQNELSAFELEHGVDELGKRGGGGGGARDDDRRGRCGFEGTNLQAAEQTLAALSDKQAPLALDGGQVVRDDLQEEQALLPIRGKALRHKLLEGLFLFLGFETFRFHFIEEFFEFSGKGKRFTRAHGGVGRGCGGRTLCHDETGKQKSAREERGRTEQSLKFGFAVRSAWVDSGLVCGEKCLVFIAERYGNHLWDEFGLGV